MEQHKAQRVGVFVDVSNMYHSAKQIHKAKLNFDKVLKEAVGKRQLVRAFAYAIHTEAGKEDDFHEALSRIGFEVKLKDLQVFSGGAKKGDWDVGLAMDVVRMTPKMDVCVLVSGDGDFTELLEYVHAHGCRAEVMAIEKSCSSKLKDEADMFTNLSGKFLIKNGKRSGKKDVSKSN